MNLLKLLNKKLFFIFLSIFFISNNLNSNEPIDIWDIEKIKKIGEAEKNNNSEYVNTDTNSNVNINDSNLIYIEQDEKINSNKSKLVGLYDPAENDLNLNMWELSDGEKIIKLIEKIQKIKLSNDAKNIYKKIILTNAFPPENNINVEEFTNLKIKWLINNNDLDLIKEFIIKNDEQTYNNELIKYYLDKNLSLGKIDNICEVFSLI